MVRVEALPGQTQELLRVVAASGCDVTQGLLARVSAGEGPVLVESLREAMTHHVLVQRHGSEGFAFRHALMREAVYEDLLPGERGDLHARLAEALSADPALSADGAGPAAELAWHWFQAHDLPRALAASIQAADQAERMRAPPTRRVTWRTPSTSGARWTSPSRPAARRWWSCCDVPRG